MNPQSREIEFKFGVPDRLAFERLIKHLGLSPDHLEKGITQTNHFFDSSALCLRNQGFVIRLREQNGAPILTIKGEQQSPQEGSGVLSNRFEQEVGLPAETAGKMLAGKLPPREAIARNFGSDAGTLLDIIENACGGEALVHVGAFRNVRIILPDTELTLVDISERVTFELDTSTFPDGSVDHEIEIEITPHSPASDIESALIDLFRHAGIDWFPSPSKAKRFFAALAADNAG